MITAQEAQAIVPAGKDHFIIHKCGFCGYACGFYFRNGGIQYDNGCNCVFYDGWRDTTWQELADVINLQTDPSIWIAKLQDPTCMEHLG